MKLVLYSGGHAQLNHELDAEVLRLTGRVRPTLAFIPADDFHAEEDFEEYAQTFSQHGVRDFFLFIPGAPHENGDVQRLLSCDAIFMGGGNTFSFLHALRRQYLLPQLMGYAQRGGVLAGLSAGAILMTPHITMAAVPEFDRDPNDVGLRHLGALNLVNFEFFPHFVNRPRYSSALRAYSVKCVSPVIACPDGSGIVVDDRKLCFVGRAWAFAHGKRIRLHRVGVS